MKHSILLSLISLLSSVLLPAAISAQTLSLTPNQWATARSLNSGAVVTDYTQAPITLSFSQGTGSPVTYNGTAIAAAEGNTITVSAATGYQLTAMSFTQNVAAQATRLAGNTWSAGSASVNAQNNKQVDWTGAAQTVSVSFTGNQVFTAFSVTYEDMNKSFTVTFVGADGIVLKTESVLYGSAATPPTPPSITNKVFIGWDNDYTNITEDITITALYDFSPEVMKDTVEITPKEIMDYNELTSGEYFDAVDFTKDGVTIAVSKASASGSPRILYDGYYSNYPLRLGTNHTITISAPYKIHKVVMGTWYSGDEDSFACNTGEITKGERNVILRDVIWTGSTSKVTITIGSIQSWDFSAIYFHVIGDKTDTQCNVTFYDFDGNVLNSQPVAAGGSITTPPTINDDCFTGWDTPLNGIYDDLEIHPIREKLLDLTAEEWYNAGSGSITRNGFTFYPTNRWNNNKVEFGDTDLGNWNYKRHVVLYTDKPFTIVGKEWFQSVTFVCPDNNADKLAQASFSNGTAKQDGNNVVWSGDTDSLIITPTQNCNIFEFIIYCQQHETPSFTVIFVDANDKEIKRETVLRGSAVTPPANPTAPDECHYFTNWDADLNKVRGDMTVHPVFGSKDINLTAEQWGTTNSIEVNGNMTDITVNGYSFSASDFTYIEDWGKYYIEVSEEKTLTITGEQNLMRVIITVPTWESVNAIQNATYSSGSIERGRNQETGSWENYFIWKGDTKQLTITFPSKEDKWDANARISEIDIPCIASFTVTFVDYDGKVLNVQDVKPHASAIAPDTPTRYGYKFTEWNADFSNVIDNLTITAQYEWDDEFIHVYFEDFSGDTLSIVPVLPGGTAVAPEAPALKCHTFTGWDTPLTNIRFEPVVDNRITVTLSKDNISSSSLYLYAWTDDNSEPLGVWPGKEIQLNDDNEYSYTFDESITSININWNWGSNQRVSTNDYTGITQSTCYRSRYLSNFQSIEAIDCPAQATGLTIRPIYSFNKDSKEILTVAQTRDMTYQINEKQYAEGYYAVRGIVSEAPSTLEDGGRLTFRIIDEGANDYENIQGYQLLGPDVKPFISTLQLQKADTVIIFGKLLRYNYSELRIEGGYVPYIGRQQSDEGILYLDLPDAATMYDISGNGMKQAFIFNNGNILQTGDITADFSVEKTMVKNISTSDNNAIFLSDINRDSEIDLGIAAMSKNGSISTVSLLSGDNGYTKVDGALFLPQFDLNGDGRTDHLVVDPKSWFVSDFGAGGGLGYGTTYRENHYYIGTQQPDGTYNLEYVQAMTWDEYEALLSDTEWAATYKEKTYSSGNGLITPNYGYATAMLSGVSISEGRAPRRFNGGNSENGGNGENGVIRRAPAIGYTVNSITKALDLNADNLIDLIDEKNGNVYLNMGDGRFIIAETNGLVVPADLNNDGLMDFIFPGEKLYVSIYKGEGEFETKTLYENAAVDALLYCYDFDRDGDIDILATFSAATNATGIAYTCFFLNDGQGNFTQQPEQNYGSDNLWFSALQDIDGDGYYDLLAFRGETDTEHWSLDVANYGFVANGNPLEVVWLRGNQNNQFSTPQVLYTIDHDSRLRLYNIDAKATLMRINAEDLDNDGKAEIWVSGLAQGKTRIFTTEFGEQKTFGVTSNTAPTAPTAPELRYENGMLTVTWGDGSDKETMTGDLTYALRLGTTQGGNDILSGFANADGSRRNFLDGNMVKNHSYMIDLSTYAPATIYAAVQAIDAQHKGSAWSAEASIEHTALPAQFTLSSEKIAFNEIVTVSYTALPDGYSHKWLYDDGELRRDGSFLKLSFPTAGEKVITHTVTAPDGKAASYSMTLTVLPAGLSDEAIEFSDWSDYNNSSNNFRTMSMNPKADFNGDGLLDVFSVTSNNYFVSQATSLTEYTQATGLWNTNITGSGAKWLDWNRNGYADLLTYTYSRAEGYHYYILPHADNAQDMTAQKEDATIEGTLRYAGASETTNYYYLYPLAADMLNNGVPSVFGYTYFNSSSGIENASFRVVQSDGSYNYIPISTNGDILILGQALNNAQQSGQISNDVRDGLIDYNRDGFTDILFLNSVYKDNVNKYECLYIFQNNGNGNFTQLTIPFANEIASDDLYYPQYADLNNDGYYDIIAFKTSSDKSELYILWNNENRSFSAPEIMPVSEIGCFGGSTSDNIKLIDIDNDGYLDVLSWQKNPTLGKDIMGLYVWYMGSQGVKTQGFLIPQISSYASFDYLFTEFPNELLYEESYATGSSSRTHLRRVVGVSENEKPSVPQGLRAVQTEGGLLVEWNAAEDDHTPASQMRYNLSVKHAGKTGEGAFVISPQNGLNSKSAYLPGHKYIQSTRMLVPLAYLTAGDYEVQVQAIDGRNLMSDFSETVTVNIDRQIIDAPTTICWADEALITYMSEDRTGTPVWDFDGGTIVSGTGFGPYRVSWESKGTKTITLTLGNETYSRMLYVDQAEGWANLPNALFDGGSVEVEWADNLSGDLWISINGALQSITKKGIDGRDPQLTFDGHTLTLDTRKAWNAANALTNFESIGLILYLSNANGCEASAQSSVQIINASNIPQISLVTSDADGHNIISWNADADLFPQIQVLKETNIRDQFVELGVVSTNLGQYTDLSSDATQRAERYAIRGIMQGGTLTPVSPVHKTVHTTINRGATDNQWNLIWNQYVGADVVSYNILRGSAEGTLTQIASLSSYNTSYTDYAPQDAQPFYAIEYVLSTEQQAPQEISKSSKSSKSSIISTPVGRSNIVNRTAAKTMTYAQSLTILSANGKYETTKDNTMLLLYAEVMPSNTTYKQVVWEITEQKYYPALPDDNAAEESILADIDPSSGLLTARTPNPGGIVTVKATAIDGSGVTATRQIQIAAINENTPVQPTYFFVVFFSWDGTVITTQTVEQGHFATAPQAPDREGYTFIGWSIEGNSDLMSAQQINSMPINSNTAIIAQYELITAIDENYQDPNNPNQNNQDPNNPNATNTKTLPRKLFRNGSIYIILPDNTTYTITGQKLSTP